MEFTSTNPAINQHIQYIQHIEHIGHVQHVRELAWRTGYWAFRLILRVGVVFLYRNLWLRLVLKPLGEGVFTSLIGIFTTSLQLGFRVACWLAWISGWLHLFAYFAPSLYPREHRIFTRLLALSLGSWVFRLWFWWKQFIPALCSFCLSLQTRETRPSLTNLTYLPEVQTYLDMASTSALGISLAFQLPIVFLVGVLLNFWSANRLAKNRRYLYFGLFGVATLLSPPDVLSQLLLACPLFFLFELSLFVCFWWLIPTDSTDSTDPN